MLRRCFILLTVFVLILGTTTAFANETEGDMYTFCPAISMLSYNGLLKSFLDLNDNQAALLQVSSDGLRDGNIVYSDLSDNTFFIFGGASNEYDTADTAYVYCSLKEASTLRNIPMILWASIIEVKYNGEIKQTGSSFLEWVNTERKDGDTYTSPYFTALYHSEPFDYCSLLIKKR